MTRASEVRPVGRIPSICFVTTLPYQANVFLSSHIRTLAGVADVTIVTNGKRDDLCPSIRERVRFRHLAIERTGRPVEDLKALYRLARILREERPDLIQSMTPKAGLLGMLAARVVGIPARIHWFTGQVWQNSSGPARAMLRASDRLVVQLSTEVLVDSPSQRDYLVDMGIGPRARMTVLGKGSVRGVDTARFRPCEAHRGQIRAQLGLGPEDRLALFVGRLTKDKGLLELAAAMRALRHEVPGLHVALVGFEEGAFMGTMRAAMADAHDRLHVLGFTEAPERPMAAADFLVLPSHREGFGSTVIEAAACGTPSIGTRIHGLTDAIEDEVTGILVPPANPVALAHAMRQLASEAELRARLGAAALARARRDFEGSLLTNALLDFYGQALGARLR
jgi:glycosyltransferase involved in cell wall biosynthesis